MVTFLPEYTWQSAEFPICVIDVPLADLAQRLGIPVISWEEDGMGSVSGFVCRLPSGEVLLLEEYAHAREHLGVAGPNVCMEATTLVDLGIEHAVAVVLAGLGISSVNLAWVQTEAGLQAARQVAGHAK